MDLDLRPVRKLRESAAARAALGPLIEAVCASPADLGRARVVCDWIQYKQNFREPVVGRPVGDTDTEIAFDLRRCAEIDLNAHVKQALAEGQSGLALEPWVPGRDSCIWRFNQLYWQALSHWEVATGREYEQSLPGVGAVRSRGALDYMRDKVPGVYVPDDVYRRLRAVPADQTAAEGARLAAEIIQQLSAIEGVAGVHLLAAGNEQAVPGILDSAGIWAGVRAERHGG